MEVWKDIYIWENGVEYDYRGLYQVSNFGNVKSLTGKEKILKSQKDINGYLFIGLCKNGKKKQFKVHRLVAHMFVDGYFENAQVNHIDENKTNNHVSNLEWCDRKYNMNYGSRNKRASEKMKGKTLSEETKAKISEAKKGENNPMYGVHKYGKDSPNSGKLIARYDKQGSLIDIKYQFEYAQDGFNAGNISNCCKGKYKTCQDFIFRYATDDDINQYIIKTKQIRIE